MFKNFYIKIYFQNVFAVEFAVEFAVVKFLNNVFAKKVIRLLLNLFG